MSDSTTIHLTFGVSALETFDVLGAGLDELSLCQSAFPPGYQWIARGAPVVSGEVIVTDPDDPHSPETYGGLYTPSDDGSTYGRRSMFSPGNFASYYNPSGFHRMTRDSSSGLFTPFLGGPTGPLWNNQYWGILEGNSLSGFNGNCNIGPAPIAADHTGFGVVGSSPITVAGSVDGHAFSCQGFVQWNGSGSISEAGTRTIDSVTYGGDGAISLVITPLEYWTYAPRIDPGHPTYDGTTGAVATNPATGAPWTIQEIISRQGP